MQLSSASSAGRRNGTSATNLLAAKAGAGYLSIFVGRLDDTGQDEISVVRDTVQVVKNYEFQSEVLAAKYPASASCYAVCPGRVSCGDDSTCGNVGYMFLLPERMIIPHVNLPFGSSLICIAQKRGR